MFMHTSLDFAIEAKTLCPLSLFVEGNFVQVIVNGMDQGKY